MPCDGKLDTRHHWSVEASALAVLLFGLPLPESHPNPTSVLGEDLHTSVLEDAAERFKVGPRWVALAALKASDG
jgi:hypothetical protein